MDRRAKKLDKKRKSREVAKKQARALAARRPDAQQLFVRAAAHRPFGPCLINAEWEETHSPALVQALVTRALADGRLLPGIALVDRTCLGVKDGFVANPIWPRDLPDFAAHVGRGHRGMLPCEPLVVQSVVFHAVDYARKLGFEPHPDFPAPLFGPRPQQLLATAWHAPERPLYFSGPRDDLRGIMNQLTLSVGAGNFSFLAGGADPYFEIGAGDEEDYDEDDADSGLNDSDAIPTFGESV